MNRGDLLIDLLSVFDHHGDLQIQDPFASQKDLSSFLSKVKSVTTCFACQFAVSHEKMQ